MNAASLADPYAEVLGLVEKWMPMFRNRKVRQLRFDLPGSEINRGCFDLNGAIFG